MCRGEPGGGICVVVSRADAPPVGAWKRGGMGAGAGMCRHG